VGSFDFCCSGFDRIPSGRIGFADSWQLLCNCAATNKKRPAEGGLSFCMICLPGFDRIPSGRIGYADSWQLL